MTANTPRVTIGITAYNAAETVMRAVKSAQAQDWSDFEIIAVDDCSTDNTFAVLQKAAEEIPVLKIFRQARNGGVAQARNRILAEAQGSFVTFFDDDDESAPIRVRSQLQTILAYEAALSDGAPVICHTARRQIFPDGSEHVEAALGDTRIDGIAAHGPAVARRILLGEAVDHAYGACATCSQMARRSTYVSIGGFDDGLRRSEDTDLNIRLALAGAHFLGIAEPLVTQYMTPGWDKSFASECNNMLKVLEKQRAFIDENGSYNFAVEWLKLKFRMQEGGRIAFLRGLLPLAFRYPLRTAHRLRMASPRVGGASTLHRFRRNLENDAYKA